jgi:uncharacterized protein (TIGR03067 family)
MRPATPAAVLCLALAAAATAGQQPAPKGKAAPEKSDLDRLQGTWFIVGLEAGGKAQPEKNYRGNAFTFARDKGDKAILREGGFPPIEYGLAVDPAKSPKAIDLSVRGMTVRGVYKLDGDDLTLCLSAGGERPGGFATRPGGDAEVFTLRRSRWERHADKAGGFSVELPAKPEERKRDLDTPAGRRTATVFVARDKADPVTYLAAVVPLAPDAGKAADEAEKGLKKVLVEEAGGGAVSAEEVRSSSPFGATVREVTLTLEAAAGKEKLTARARLFVAGDRLYALMAVGSDEAVRNGYVTWFWNSYRPVTGKK